MDPKFLGKVVDQLRAMGEHHDADILQFGVLASGDGSRCRACGRDVKGNPKHRCWDEQFVTIEALEAERDILRKVLSDIHGGLIGKNSVTKDWWHAHGFIKGPTLIEVLRIVADDDPENIKARDTVTAVEAALIPTPDPSEA